MYTIALRPHAPKGAQNCAINFEQSTGSWSPAKFAKSETPATADTAHGLYAHSPLESIDIEPAQVGLMIAGLELAYNTLVEDLWEAADRDLKDTPFMDRKGFMSCFMGAGGATGGFSVSDDTPSPYVFLRDIGSGKTIGWNGRNWHYIDMDWHEDDHIFCGSCFGLDVYYPIAGDTSTLKDPTELGRMLTGLLDACVVSNTDARRYVDSIFCAS